MASVTNGSIAYPSIRLMGDLTAVKDPKTGELPRSTFIEPIFGKRFGIFASATANKINSFLMCGEPLVYYLARTCRQNPENYKALAYCLEVKKADPNIVYAKNLACPTALFAAIQDVNSMAVNLLLQYSANPIERNSYEQTPIQYLQEPTKEAPLVQVNKRGLTIAAIEKFISDVIAKKKLKVEPSEMETIFNSLAANFSKSYG